MRIGLNGRCFAAQLGGVQRIGRALLREVNARGDAVLLVPREVMPNGDAGGFGAIVEGALPGRLWENLELPLAARRAGCDVTLHPANCAPRWGAARIVVVYDAAPLVHPTWFTAMFRAWFRFAVANPARRADRVLTLTDWAREQLIDAIGIPPDRVEVIPPGLEGPWTAASAEEVRVTLTRASLTPPYVLGVGAGDPRKNLGFLSRVARAWQSSRKDALQFVAVGAGTGRIYRRAALGDPAPSDLERALGRVSDAELRALYTGAVALCFPSIDEGIGLPPLEAMACGTPALVGPYGSAREVLADAAQHLPLEPEAWVEAIGRLLEDGEARRRQVDCGLRHVAERTWDRAASRVVEICGDAARRS